MVEEQKGRGATSGHPPSLDISDLRRDLAHHATSVARESNIFALPREIRNDIYRRVLCVAHPLYLFQDNISQVETFVPERPNQWLALLHVNRQIHIEAAETLYSTHTFALLDERRPQDCLLRAFLTRIGPANSASLSHLSIDFPGLEGAAEEAKLKDDSLRKLNLLQTCCTNLATLETSFSVKHVKNLERVTGENQQLTNEALSQINLRLRSIASLNTIIVRITGPSPAQPTREYMETLGWTILPAYGDK